MLSLSAAPRLGGSSHGGWISSLCGGAYGPSTSKPYILPSDRWRGGRRRVCVGFVSRVKLMVEWADNRLNRWRRSVLASDLGAGGEVGHSRPPLRARSEEELISYVRKEVDSGRLSSTIAHGLEELYHNYRNAIVQSGLPESDEIIISNMTTAFDRILIDIKNPFVFPSYHKAIREPFDYYMFGQNYIRPLVDFRKSYIGNVSIFSDMEQYLLQGHNIILFSNHQTEADPAVFALLLERTNPKIAESVVFVAGDRVVTDPLCKPFSMGRNLLCVYSKKHMFDEPGLVDLKKRANTRSLKEMAVLLKNGSQIIWIAPSGGRDRPDAQTGEWFPVVDNLSKSFVHFYGYCIGFSMIKASFDASSVDNMRRLAEHSAVPGHLYPLALLCHDIMPPPPQVEKEIGEQRRLSHHGVGLSVGPEMCFSEVTIRKKNEEAKTAFSAALYHAVNLQYSVLNSAIYDNQGLDASNDKVSLSQPWKQ